MRKKSLACIRHLEVGAAVVDDDVSDGFEVAVVQRVQALAQLPLAAIGAVQAPQVARQVPLRAHAVAGRRQPHASDARTCYKACLILQHLQQPSR